MSPDPLRPLARAFFLASATALLATAGCSSPARSLGTSLQDARRHADDLVGSLAARFGPTDRDPTFDALRPIVARYALVPSRIFDASGVWTGASGPTREVAFRGRRVRGRYLMTVDARPPAPTTPGDYRGEWRLERLRSDEYEWMAREELAVGGVSPSDLSRAVTRLFLAAESARDGDLASRLRVDLPRTAAALGRLASLDGARVRHDGSGAADILVTASIHPDGIRSFAPAYAHYLDDVVTPTRFAATASDETGARWWEAGFADGRISLHLRVHGGDLAPLTAPPASIPPRLRVRLAASSRTGFLRSGFHDMEIDLDLTRRDDEKGFVARFAKAPGWDLPILVPLLLRSALRRPFEGGGAMLAYSIQGRDGEPTLLTRGYRVAVRENWLVRWFGGYIAGAVNTFRRGEEEADRFSAEALLALREDLLALIGASQAAEQGLPAIGDSGSGPPCSARLAASPRGGGRSTPPSGS